ncbi:MAG: hypothetical protein ACHQ1H_01220 [Nitrososphaerales archaeon]
MTNEKLRSDEGSEESGQSTEDDVFEKAFGSWGSPGKAKAETGAEYTRKLRRQSNKRLKQLGI